MSKRTLLVVDCHNLFVEGGKLYPGKIVNYTNLLRGYTEGLGLELMQKVAYGRQPEDAVISFATLLKKLGFSLHFGGNSHNVQMALRVAQAVCGRTIDNLVVGTNYYEAGSLLQFARDQGIRTYAFGFNLPPVFSNLAETYELDPAVMQDRKVRKPNAESTKPIEQPVVSPTV